MIRQLSLLVPVLVVASCASPHGRVVTAESLSRFEGGGSMSTLWYYGSDGEFHYFRHLWKLSTPYRIEQDGFAWQPAVEFEGYWVNARHLWTSLATRLRAPDGTRARRAR